LSKESENEKIQGNLSEDVVTQDRIGAQMIPEEESGYDADKGGGEEPVTTELGLPQQEEKEVGEGKEEEVQVANNDYEAKVLPDNEEEDKEEQLLTATTKKPASLKRKSSSSPRKQLGRRRIQQQQQQRLQKEPSLADVSRQLDKQSSQIDKILSMLQPIQRQIKGTTTSAARQPQLIKQLQSQTKQLQRQLYQIQKNVQKNKKTVKKKK
jgi:hypothetical protein